MFAPAKEIVRVTRPGGQVLMGNRIPNDPTLVARMLKISSAYSPPPPEGFVGPMTLGHREQPRRAVRCRGVAPRSVTFARDAFVFDFAGSPARFVDEFRKDYGPTRNASDAAERDGRAVQLLPELEALFNRQNKSGRDGPTPVEATDLQVSVDVAS